MARGKRAPKESIKDILRVALDLFSRQGYGATSMREIADEAGLSVGNVYHHFASKKAVYEQLFDDYWRQLGEPDTPMARAIISGEFPDNLEQLAEAIEQTVAENRRHILLIYVDVIEFSGEHIRQYYASMGQRFAEICGPALEKKKREGRFGAVDPLVALMVAIRWFFYYYSVEHCFGAPNHLGMPPQQLTKQLIKILREGLDPRDGAAQSQRSRNRKDQAATARLKLVHK